MENINQKKRISLAKVVAILSLISTVLGIVKSVKEFTGGNISPAKAMSLVFYYVGNISIVAFVFTAIGFFALWVSQQMFKYKDSTFNHLTGIVIVGSVIFAIYRTFEGRAFYPEYPAFTTFVGAVVVVVLIYSVYYMFTREPSED
jgi:uncharacterized membrane protein